MTTCRRYVVTGVAFPQKSEPILAHHTKKRERSGGLAQLGERLPCKQEVSGSIPLISTTFKRLTEIAVKTEISLSLLKGLCDAP